LGLQSYKKSFNPEGVGLEMSVSCVDLVWNDQFEKQKMVRIKIVGMHSFKMIVLQNEKSMNNL
jgi:hypothetical protein